MKKIKIAAWVKDMLISLLILTAVFIINFVLISHSDILDMTPIICILGVFLISVFTTHYVWGIGASAISVLLVDYHFVETTKLVGVISLEGFITAFIIFSVAIITSMLTAKLKQDKKIKAEAYTERMRANLMRAVSHDLRTPLTTIYGSATAISENYDSLSFEQRMGLIRDIRYESEGLVRMVENILSVTRINQEGVNIIKTPAVLEELADSVLVKFKKHFPNIRVKVDIPDEFVAIPMDVVLIEQVLINLMENSVDHAVGMSRILFRVTVSEKLAVFEISDDGCGIPRDKLDKIFDGYFSSLVRADYNERRNMGIGLSVCAAIIKAHDGKIYAENNEEGGATFRFLLNME